jgi:alpha-ribazole phosphatase
MLELWLIRHGKTEGNRLGRYIGTTDEPLCPEGRNRLPRGVYPVPKAVFTSPMKRAVETAEILFPELPSHSIEDLSECDFGEFENKNYKELEGNLQYQAWIDSEGRLPFPGGESREAFRKRTCRGFERVVNRCLKEDIDRAALVVHGGTIMNIMEVFARQERSFYDWHVPNGGGYGLILDAYQWRKGKRCLKVKEVVQP